MKKIHLLLVLALGTLLPLSSTGQLLLNGSFEDNLVLDDSLMLTEPSFDNTVANCFTVDGGYVDVISSSSYCGAAQHGSYFIQNSSGEYYGAFSMALDAPLTVGADYNLSFWTRNCMGSDGRIIVGYTAYDNMVGTPLDTVVPASHTVWTLTSFYFTPTQPDSFLYVDLQNSSLSNQMQVDNFLLVGVLGVHTGEAPLLAAHPNPVLDSWSVTTRESGLLEWMDMSGRLVLSQWLEKGENIVRRGEVTAGMYAYRITARNGQMSQGKLLLQ